MISRSSHRRFGTVLTAVLLASIDRLAWSAELEVADDRPVAVIGETLLLSMRVEAGEPAPARLEVKLADGRSVFGEMIMVAFDEAPGASLRRWADAAAPARVEAAMGEIPPSPTHLYLWIDVPDGYADDVIVQSKRVRPRWLDPAPLVDGTTLDLVSAFDRPDATSPFEYWRWTLLADRLGMRPAEPQGNEASVRVAKHGAGVWRAAVGRISAASRGVADECVDLLTMTARDPSYQDVSFATWLTESQDLASFIDLATDTRRSGEDLANTALAWARNRSTDLALLERSGPAGASVAMINTSLGREVVRATWQGPAEIPIAQSAEGRSIARFLLRDESAPEPVLTPAGWIEPSRGLAISANGRAWRLIPPARRLWAAPPGAALPAFVPLLTLADARGGVQPVVPRDRSTSAIVRFSGGRWEVYAECMRPSDARGTAGEDIALYVGGPAEEAAQATVRVRESGEIIVERSPKPSTLVVNHASFPDRWRARIILPDEWLPVAAIDELTVGMSRTHGDTGATETSGLPCLPWNIEPSRLTIRLEAWNGSEPVRAR